MYVICMFLLPMLYGYYNADNDNEINNNNNNNKVGLQSWPCYKADLWSKFLSTKTDFILAVVLLFLEKTFVSHPNYFPENIFIV